MTVTVGDDFADPVNERFGDAVLDLHRARGVEILRRDVIEERLELRPSRSTA